MKLIAEKLKHVAEGFVLEVTTCNARVATTVNVETGDVIKFNRLKLEWMIKKNIFQIM